MAHQSLPHPFVTMIDVHGIVENPTWAMTQEAIISLQYKRNAVLSLYGKDAQMMVEFVQNHGFYISVFGIGEIVEWLAIDEQKSGDLVICDISGNSDSVPNHIFVSAQQAIQAVQEFFDRGVRSSQFGWISSIEVMERLANREERNEKTS